LEEQVTLEAYADQNRALIDNQRNNEALAICKHILRYYPKHLDTYRQMGEAYLNLQDLESAKDIFSRVLSADPEDMIAYIGLSTIFEQNHLYEEAVWYLERAYELSPENIEIQKELLRLYPEIGIRMQQRVEMTHGALARLYIREGLYPQAIQELESIIAQSPNRYDARVALAETLWHAGYLRQAAEVSEKLLATLPYCLKANLLLGTVWKESGLTEGDSHLQRAQEVDPTNKIAQQIFGARASLPVLQITVPRYVEAAQVVESTVTEQSTAPSQVDTSEQSWSFEEPVKETETTETDFFNPTPSLFDVQPASAETQTSQSESSTADQGLDDLPDWLKSEFVSPTEEFKPEATRTEDEKTPLETWVTEAQQSEQQTETPSPEISYEQAQALLAQLLSGTTTETPPAQETSPAAVTPTEEEIPEWLKGWQVAPEESAATKEPTESEQTASQTQDLPDWLRGLQPMSEETPAAEIGEPEIPQAQDLSFENIAEEQAPTEIAEPSDEQADELPAWLAGIKPVSEEQTPTQVTEPSAEQADELPAWLAGIKPVSEEQTPTQVTEPSAEQADELPGWLEDIESVSEEQSPATPVAEETDALAESPAPSSFEWTDNAPIEEKPIESGELSFEDFLANLESKPAKSNEPASSKSAMPDFLAGLPKEFEAQPISPEIAAPDFLASLPAEIETASTPQEYQIPDFLDETETATPSIPESIEEPEIPLPDFLSSLPVEEKPVTPSESYPIPSFIEMSEPAATAQPITPAEEWAQPEMPPAPVAVDTAPSIVVETLPARAEKVVKPKKPKRPTKGAERLEQARKHRDANEIEQALAEYDYLVQRAPRLVKEVIDDLEVLIQRLDAPLDAHRILGDAYTRNDRLNDALERYRFVMEHSPKASE
jgi:tetratricopeptide (TPR) repeat protein